MRKSLTAFAAAGTLGLATIAAPTTATPAGVGGVPRWVALPSERSSEARSQGPLTAITDITAIPRTATPATRPPITATRTRPAITAAGAGAIAIGCAERSRPAWRTDDLNPAIAPNRRIALPPKQPTRRPIPTQIPTN